MTHWFRLHIDTFLYLGKNLSRNVPARDHDKRDKGVHYRGLYRIVKFFPKIKLLPIPVKCLPISAAPGAGAAEISSSHYSPGIADPGDRSLFRKSSHTRQKTLRSK
jgi:hypothetical protein